MNLPSIFKSVPVMKPSNHITNSKSDKYEMNVPQDMFGLGIQVFKIQSRKQITNSGNPKSLSKARQDIKAIQNPVRRSNNPPLGPIIPKPKKTSALLPSINKTPSQKQYKVDGVTKTDSIIGRKSIQKNRNIRQASKVQAIQQYNNPNYNHPRNGPQKNKTFTTSRPVNKSMDAVPQTDKKLSTISHIKPFYKDQWRESLNILRNFVIQLNQYVVNQSTKVGRKKNQQYIGEQLNFVQAYITKNPYEYEEQLYDPFSIENYKIQKNASGFQDLHFQDYAFN